MAPAPSFSARISSVRLLLLVSLFLTDADALAGAEIRQHQDGMMMAAGDRRFPRKESTRTPPRKPLVTRVSVNASEPEEETAAEERTVDPPLKESELKPHRTRSSLSESVVAMSVDDTTEDEPVKGASFLQVEGTQDDQDEVGPKGTKEEFEKQLTSNDEEAKKEVVSEEETVDDAEKTTTNKDVAEDEKEKEDAVSDDSNIVENSANKADELRRVGEDAAEDHGKIPTADEQSSAAAEHKRMRQMWRREQTKEEEKELKETKKIAALKKAEAVRRWRDMEFERARKKKQAARKKPARKSLIASAAAQIRTHESDEQLLAMALLEEQEQEEELFDATESMMIQEGRDEPSEASLSQTAARDDAGLNSSTGMGLKSLALFMGGFLILFALALCVRLRARR